MPTPVSIKTLIFTEEKEREIDFDSIRIRLASPEDIISWSYGEVLKPETINYRTQKPEIDGLFCEKIFGPTKDYECYCGKYKRIRYKGIICDRCGVEVTTSLVRRYRMGHIKLATPIAHIWFVRVSPSRIGLALNLSADEVEKVVYFANFIITEVDEEEKRSTLVSLEKEYKSKVQEKKEEYRKKEQKIKNEFLKTKSKKEKLLEVLNRLDKNKSEELKKLKEIYEKNKEIILNIKPLKLLSEQEFQKLSIKYGHIFKADIGAGALYEILKKIDIDRELDKIIAELKATKSEDQYKKLMRRYKLFKSFKKNGAKLEWMILTVLPVMPPDLRPIVQLDGGRFASSDVNDLYRRVINRNNRLKRLLEINAPEVICRNEKRMLQEAVDALLDNSMRKGKTVTMQGAQKRALKSIADMLRGKKGRFRQNLLGKRTDYSARSVIVVGPKLRLFECGIPKIMALELFRPFVISKLIKKEYAYNVRKANRIIEDGEKIVWDILEEITKDKVVLLNRAPTLHRISIQAFKPKLIEGKAIQIHPLVCPAYNADFDGDQMAVFLPLSEEAQKEAKNLMMSTKNILKPATGDPIVMPSKDIVLGVYFLTTITKNPKKPKAFSNIKEAKLAFESKIIELQEKIKVIIDGELKETSVGRIIFNEVLPEGISFINEEFTKKNLGKLVSEILVKYGREVTGKFLDELMDLAFEYLTISGITWGMDDIPEIPEKKQLIKKGEEMVERVNSQYEMGFLTDRERYLKILEIWAYIKDKITDMCVNILKKRPNSSVYAMAYSGARGSWTQVSQMMGMKGLVVSPSGETIELPVKSSFKEGFDVLEYFISTHGARKGLTDTALRTSNAGYLTRRLIDVSQDVIVTEVDCKDKEGFLVTLEDANAHNLSLGTKVRGRVLACDLKDNKGNVIAKRGDIIDFELSEKIDRLGIKEVRIRSVLKCKVLRGVCQKCYGWDLGYNEMVQLGTPVGIVAAQSIGEPGTQLTMRTFHTGGVAGRDITQGLPRVEEIFEASSVKNKAILAEISGIIKLDKNDDIVKISIIDKNGKNIKKYEVESSTKIYVKNGEKVEKGEILTEGSVDIKELYRLKGKEHTQKHILREIQQIYSSQGQDLSDKHIEIIARQMFSRVYIKDAGDTYFLEGTIIDKASVEEANKEIKKIGGKPAKYEVLLLGITKASLFTGSFLSAASFQETSRVLTDAAVTGKIDKLYGLKENVIIGRLIPAGTGFYFKKEKSKKNK